VEPLQQQVQAVGVAVAQVQQVIRKWAVAVVAWAFLGLAQTERLEHQLVHQLQVVVAVVVALVELMVKGLLQEYRHKQVAIMAVAELVRLMKQINLVVMVE
jgi:hypothetical protein